MTGKIAIAVLIVMAMFPRADAAASAGGDARNLKALEDRISNIENALKQVVDLVTKDAEGTLRFYKETGEAIKRANARWK